MFNKVLCKLILKLSKHSIKNHRQHKVNMLKVLLLPLKIVLPFKSYFSPFLIGMAKRLLLGSESIKLC